MKVSPVDLSLQRKHTGASRRFSAGEACRIDLWTLFSLAELGAYPTPCVSVQAHRVDLLKLRLADMPKVCYRLWMDAAVRSPAKPVMRPNAPGHGTFEILVQTV